MNRVAGLVLAGLVLLLNVTLTWPQSLNPTDSDQVMCPASGKPNVECDAAGNCFGHCCLFTGLCPSASCVASLDAATDAGTLCAGSCLDNVACIPFNPTCLGTGNENCIGTIACLTENCDGRSAGSVCIFAGGSRNFSVCE